jgi:formate hydrogenlyase subunit 3/multisubunit Na+/H+ antiporter MnhD subunit
MKATYFLPALPIAAVVAGVLFLVAIRFRRLRLVALTLYTLSLPTLAFLTYHFWDHYVGPDTFSIWRFRLSPTTMPFVLPLAVASPLLLWVVENKGLGGGKENAASALACFGLAAAMAAVMSDHLFLLAGLFALASWLAVAAVVMRGRRAGRLLPFLLPLGLADLSLALGVLFFYLADPTRGLFFPPSPLATSGMLSAACALMLAAALLRLGAFPLHRWMAGVSRGGKDLRVVHLLAVDLTLGVFLLFTASRIFFQWDGVWVWVCFGLAAVTLVELSRELLHADGREEAWGLLCATLGACLALVASPGGQAAAAALRLGLWAGVPALALVNLGSEGGEDRSWARVVGGATLLGLPPLAGFAWLWMGFGVLAGEFSRGETVLFLAAIPLLFMAAMVMGAVALLLPEEVGERTPAALAVTGGVLLAACSAAVGLYAGKAIDLLMREYGLPVEIPFASWSSLGWAVFICVGLAVIILFAWTRRRAGTRIKDRAASRALPLMKRRVDISMPLLSSRRSRGIVVLCEIAIYLAWVGTMVYLAFK